MSDCESDINKLKNAFMENIAIESYRLIKEIEKRDPKRILLIKNEFLNQIITNNDNLDSDFLNKLRDYNFTYRELEIPASFRFYLNKNILLCTFIDAFFDRRNHLTVYVNTCFELDASLLHVNSYTKNPRKSGQFTNGTLYPSDSGRFYGEENLLRNNDNKEMIVNSRMIRIFKELTYLAFMRLDDTFVLELSLFVTESIEPILYILDDLYAKYNGIFSCVLKDTSVLNTTYKMLLDNFLPQLPEFLRYTFDNHDHTVRQMYLFLIVSIPFILQNSHLLDIKHILPVYNIIPHIKKEYSPDTAIGFYIHIQFFTVTHIKMIYRNIVEKISVLV